MDRPITVEDLTDQERRWMVQIFGALQNHIQDELEYEEILHHDPTIVDDHERKFRLWSYVNDQLAQCMAHTDPEETARLGAWYAALREEAGAPIEIFALKQAREGFPRP